MMGLQDQLSQEPSGDTSEVEINSLADAQLGDAHRIQVFGGAGTGKTTFALSVCDLWESRGLDPSEVMLGFLDMDGGVAPLIRKGLVPEKYKSSIAYTIPEDWDELTGATDRLLGRLQDVRDEHGPLAAWLVEDNDQSAWEYARDEYALKVFGMRETELAVQKRKEARASGKKTSQSAPTFVPRADYGAINGIYGEWAEKLKFSGVNIVSTAPEKEVYEDDEKTGEVRPGGQKWNEYRFHEILHLRREDDGFYADSYKTREGTKHFRNMEDPSVLKLVKFLEGDG